MKAFVRPKFQPIVNPRIYLAHSDLFFIALIIPLIFFP